jgi:hypothetical protein
MEFALAESPVTFENDAPPQLLHHDLQILAYGRIHGHDVATLRIANCHRENSASFTCLVLI